MTPAEFEAGVQLLHESDSTLDSWEFLRMSRDEYAERVTGKRSDPPRTELYTYDHSGNVLSVDVQPVPNWTGPG